MVMSNWARSRWAKSIYTFSHILEKLSFSRVRLQVYLFCAQPIGSGALTAVRDDPGTVVQAVSMGDALPAHFPRPQQTVRERFEQGATCFAVTVKGQFAGHIWLAGPEWEEDELRCKYVLPSGDKTIWDFDVYIEPAHRSGRTLGRIWKGVDAVLGGKGVKWSFSRISLFNGPSIQVHERLGSRHVATGVFVSVGPVQLSLFSKPPFCHFGIVATQRPTLVLQIPKALMPPKNTNAGAVALVLGLDSHGLAVVRALDDAGVTVYAVENDATPPGVATRNVAKTFYANHFDEMQLLQALPKIRHKLSAHSEVVLVAINDRQVEIIGKHMEQLQPLYKIAWSHCAATVLDLQRKDSLEKRSLKQGLNYPRSAVFSQSDQTQDTTTFHYPTIIKPVRPLSSFKTLLARDHDELLQLIQAHPQDLPILCQEYIEGDDQQIFFGALLLDHGKVIHGLAGRKIASYPPARGQTTIAETTENAEVLRLTEQFFYGLALSGPVSLELKRDPKGRYWVIEPTVGRTDFWAELCISAGFNQPLMEFQLATKQTVISPQYPMREFVWYDTERDPLAYIRLCWTEKSIRPRGKQQAFPYYRLRDWRVFAKAVINLFRNLMRR